MVGWRFSRVCHDRRGSVHHRADWYVDNAAFQIKLALLLMAGINIAIFHLRTLRTVGAWDQSASAPLAARLAGAASLTLWVGVMLAGRWVGHLL